MEESSGHGLEPSVITAILCTNTKVGYILEEIVSFYKERMPFPDSEYFQFTISVLNYLLNQRELGLVEVGVMSSLDTLSCLTESQGAILASFGFVGDMPDDTAWLGYRFRLVDENPAEGNHGKS